MTNKKITIIACFSYLGNKKYVFSPQYVRSDLRHIISFSHNRVGCELNNTYVITDLQPIKEIQEDFLNDFRLEVIDYLGELGFFDDYDPITTDPLNWLQCICQKIVSGRKGDELYYRVTNAVLPIIRNSNVIEFASLFTNFISITGKSHFDRTLTRLFSLNMSHLFFYYTGHGIRLWANKESYNIYLVIPGTSSSAEFYSRQDLQTRFTSVLEKIPSFVVFDCCHGEALFKFPCKITFSEYSDDLYVLNPVCKRQIETIYLSSTRNNQTCGFYVNQGQGGSLFTTYLIEFLDEIAKYRHSQNRSLLHLREVEDKIQKYRINAVKKPQNILIGLSKESITHFPLWLFNNITNPRFQLMEQDD